VKLHLSPTDKFIEINSTRCRVWEGRSDGGVPCHAFVALVGVHRSEDSSAFERELCEVPAPRPADPEVRAFPARLIL
jgi:hypothetical protein